MTEVTPRPKAKPRKRAPRQNYMEQADKLFGRLIRKNGRCTVEGCANTSIQCAHVISRRYLTLRVDFGNAVPLCSSHHTFWTHRPLEWEEWANEHLDGAYERNKQQALADLRAGVTVDWPAKLAELRARCEREGVPTK